MQHDSLAIPPWILESLKWLAGIGAGGLIVRLVTLYQNRHKPAAETHKTDAETTEITIRASSNAGDAVIRMMDRLGEAQQNIDRLRHERDAWQDEYDKAFTERDELLRSNDLLQQEIKNYENQIKTMGATLALNDVNYDGTQDAQPPDYELPSK